MLLKNTSKRLITINTTPYISKAEALERVKAGDTLYYTRVNIAPDEQKEIPNEHCSTDFVRNLIAIGNIAVLDSKDNSNPEPPVTPSHLVPAKADSSADLSAENKSTKRVYAKPKTRKDNPDTLEKYRTQAKLLQISYEDKWSVTDLKRAIKSKQNNK